MRPVYYEITEHKIREGVVEKTDICVQAKTRRTISPLVFGLMTVTFTQVAQGVARRSR